jgi:hypothetical protein
MRNIIVNNHQRHIDITAAGMDKMISTDSENIAVTGNNDHF